MPFDDKTDSRGPMWRPGFECRVQVVLRVRQDGSIYVGGSSVYHASPGEFPRGNDLADGTLGQPGHDGRTVLDRLAADIEAVALGWRNDYDRRGGDSTPVNLPTA